MTSWYALYTKPRQEQLVAGQLHKLGLEVFLPQFQERRRGQPPKQRSLFPCYLFVQADLEVTGLSVLRWTPGLRRVVAFGGEPARVPPEAIKLVRKRLAQLEAAGGFPQSQFRPGDTVRIKKGPLAGLEAVFEGPLGPAERVRILIRFLGEANRALVPVDSLEAVQPRKHPPRRTRGRGRRIK